MLVLFLRRHHYVESFVCFFDCFVLLGLLSLLFLAFCFLFFSGSVFYLDFRNFWLRLGQHNDWNLDLFRLDTGLRLWFSLSEGTRHLESMMASLSFGFWVFQIVLIILRFVEFIKENPLRLRQS